LRVISEELSHGSRLATPPSALCQSMDNHDYGVGNERCTGCKGNPLKNELSGTWQVIFLVLFSLEAGPGSLRERLSAWSILDWRAIIFIRVTIRGGANTSQRKSKEEKEKYDDCREAVDEGEDAVSNIMVLGLARLRQAENRPSLHNDGDSGFSRQDFDLKPTCNAAQLPLDSFPTLTWSDRTQEEKALERRARSSDGSRADFRSGRNSGEVCPRVNDPSLRMETLS
jgi:hypothetical protein